MHVSGIRTCAGFYDHNITESRQPQQEVICADEPREPQQEMPRTDGQHVDAGERTDVRITDAAGSASSHRQGGFDEQRMTDHSVAQWDVEWALSDLKKDAVLVQYQFFVGDAREYLKENSEEEHFYL